MKPTLNILASLFISLALSGAVGAQRVKTPPIYLDVAIDDLVSQVAGIRSDDPDNDPSTANAYSHGIDSVSAQFTENGYFAFRSGVRTVRAVYSTSLGDSQTADSLPSEDNRQNVEFLTFVGDGILQTMPIGTARCQGFAVNISLDDAAGTRRTIGYRAGRGVLTNTGFVKVTHPDADTWVLESDSQGTCPSGSNESTARVRDAKTKGRSVPDVDYGRFVMPLRIVLTRR